MTKQSANIKGSIKHDLKKLKQWEPFSSGRLVDYLHSIGWSVRTFDEFQLNDLELANYALGKPSFAIKHNGGNFVFLKRSVTEEEEKICLLLHEIGHILYHHNLENLSAWDEAEASAFAAELRPNASKQKNSRLLFLGACTLCLVLCGAMVFSFVHKRLQNQVSSDPFPAVSSMAEGPSLPANNTLTMNSTVYITSAGDKYHLFGCRYIKNKSNVVTLPLEKALELGKTPCSLCIKQSSPSAIPNSNE